MLKRYVDVKTQTIHYDRNIPGSILARDRCSTSYPSPPPSPFLPPTPFFVTKSPREGLLQILKISLTLEKKDNKKKKRFYPEKEKYLSTQGITWDQPYAVWRYNMAFDGSGEMLLM